MLLALVALETVLSADNAVALAAFMQPLSRPKQQGQALNWGLADAFVRRISLLFTATWVMQFWQFEFVGALYLLWLAGKYFWEQFRTAQEMIYMEPSLEAAPTFWRVIWRGVCLGVLKTSRGSNVSQAIHSFGGLSHI
ncbi:TerC family protein [Microcoleus sp. FACHB-672]|uniref:TerC family protein n=1 Tax=Microcoleus sp. FACHB-672 TaxID=2692825 RepID=UPI002B26C12C|nr:hypothetical protein [Microcoleus sp. FACHB-672]